MVRVREAEEELGEGHQPLADDAELEPATDPRVVGVDEASRC
jgi:hypothetical protein